jgi:hypothetical protein
VVLGEPEALVAPFLGMLRQITGIVQRIRRRCSFGNMRKVQD